MRKNKMMRAASALLVAVLLTTSTISGTFAKYVTTASGSDVARVAKWGVEVGVDGTLFAQTYKDAPETEENIITVEIADSTEGNNLVAPGTKNEEGITFVLKGTPEVDYKLEIEVESSDIVLPADEYVDYTEATGVGDDGNPTYGNFSLSEDYYPVVFTLANGDDDTLIEGTLEEVEIFLESLSKDAYDANTPIDTLGTGENDVRTDGTYTLTWAWDFDKDTVDGTGISNDKADTYLGNVMAGIVTEENDAVTGIDFKLKITVTQVD